MTVTTEQTQTGRGRGFAAREGLFADFSKRLSVLRARRAVYTRTRNELIMLSDRELADINIPRRSIHRVATEAARLAVPNA